MTAAGAEVEQVDLRLAPAALTAWAVTAAGTQWQAPGAAVAVVAVVLLAGASAWYRHRAAADPMVASVLAVAVVGAGFAAAIAVRSYQVHHHPITARFGATAMVRVTPTEVPRPVAGGRLLIRGTLHRLDDAASSGLVVVFAPAADYGEMSVGRPADFRAVIGPPTRQDLTVAVLSAKGSPRLGEPSPIQRAAQRVRDGVAQAARNVLPPDQAAMFPALVLGDTSAVTGQVTTQFRTSGLTHLTAVSGANVTIVCGVLLLTASLIGPRLAVALAALGLVGFVVIVTPSASVLRAAAMGAVTLLAVLTQRRRQAISALGASVLALLVWSPQLAVDVGFALSVVATAGIVVVAPVWARRMEQCGWPRAAAAALSVAAVAQLVTAPLIAGISGAFSVVAVVANVAVAPVIPPITILGTAAAAVSTQWPALAQLLIRFTGPELWWLLSVARWTSALPGASVPTPSGLSGVVTVAIGGLLIVVGWRRRWVRRAAAGCAVILLAWVLAGQVVGAVGPT